MCHVTLDAVLDICLHTDLTLRIALRVIARRCDRTLGPCNARESRPRYHPAASRSLLEGTTDMPGSNHCGLLDGVVSWQTDVW